MKVAIALLVVALSCCFESGHADLPIIPDECLERLVQVDLPGTVDKLKTLLCLYLDAENSNDVAKFRNFLEELHEDLLDAGCTADQILSTQDFLTAVGDKVGEVAKQLGTKLLELVQTVPGVKEVLDFTCQAVGKTIGVLASILGLIKGILEGLGL